MARVVAVGQPANEAERLAIAYLRDNLAAPCVVIHNFEIVQGSDIFEIDLAILTPHCVFVSDVKGTQGRVDIYGAKWYPAGRQPYHSPLAKLRQHAKALKSLICDAYPATPALRDLHVHAAVLMTAPTANVMDHGNLDGPDVIPLLQSTAYLLDTAHIPAQRTDDIRPLLLQIEAAILGKSHPTTIRQIYGSWQIEEKLGADDRCTEYRARHALLGKTGGTVRLRVYRVNPYQEQQARASEWRRVSNAYRAFADMPGHPDIIAVRDLIPAEDETSLALVTDDVAGQALSLHIKQPGQSLTFDQKISVVKGMLAALGHAHTHGVIHRNVTPDAILVSGDGTARLTAFDYARVRESGQSSFGQQIVSELDPYYQSPECFQDPSQASIGSDLFSAGLVFYELITGEAAFKSVEHVIDTGAEFPIKPSEIKPDLPSGVDGWLQKLCAFERDDRYLDAAAALHAFLPLLAPSAPKPANEEAAEIAPSNPESTADVMNLPKDYALSGRFRVQSRLGRPGGFGVAYKVFDAYGDVVRVIKLILRDRRSVFQRLLQEYRMLIQIPDHPYVVKVVWADRLPDETPYIVFEYVNGLDVGELLDAQALSREDALTLARQTAEGLAHLHKHGVYHQDIKPSNLLWTDRGVRIIDFNVASSDRDVENGRIGGTWRYTPPDLDLSVELTADQKRDRDIFALVVTLYECLTGRYPWSQTRPSLTERPASVTTLPSGEEFGAEFDGLLVKGLAPRRAERFTTAEEFLAALNTAIAQRRPRYHAVNRDPSFQASLVAPPPNRPNTNPYVTLLQTLYSQSSRTNAGTRGLDEIGKATYVPTLLDRRLRPSVLQGDYKLVIISGNAGDGKTAFIQQLERGAEKAGAQIQRGLNGTTFVLDGRTFLSNYDGSQDEGDQPNNEVLLHYLGAFIGNDDTVWPAHETRLIAINEGRLVDFLTEFSEQFPRLLALIRGGLNGGAPEAGVVVINLNLRSVVADVETANDSIFDRLLAKMTHETFWTACEACDLKTRCYIQHNVRTLTDPVAGPKVRERLKNLYIITHLRGRLHITLRDLRSALAYTLVGTENCDGVHALYNAGTSESMRAIQDGFYFNAWMGGQHRPKDRLLALLQEIDIGHVSNPELDRGFGLLEPEARAMGRFQFARPGQYDDALFRKTYDHLPRDFSAKNMGGRVKAHQDYVAMLRRRHFFERRDDEWRAMLPYQNLSRFYALVNGMEDTDTEISAILEAINKGEGLSNPARLGRKLALRVRRVERGTIRSYRLFDGKDFTLLVPSVLGVKEFIEIFPQALLLKHITPQTGNGYASQSGELRITLDVFEMLKRLAEGYQPSLEEQQGFYLSLTIFKNVLASAPYQEVLLTETGHEFYRIRRDEDGTLTMGEANEEYGDGD